MVIKVGHRGAMGYEPENTLRSFKKALDIRVDMIELDVYVCKSGELVVIHDETVNRTTNGKGKVEDKTLTELKELDAGKGEKIPTLEEVLDLANLSAQEGNKIKVNIELKGENTAEPVAKMIDKYIEEKGWSYEDFLVSSFNYKELQKFEKIESKIKTGFLSEKTPRNFIDFAEKAGAYSVNIPIEHIDNEFVENAHDHGLKVYVWRTNSLEDIKKAKLLDVDYICSNFPDKI